MPRRTLSEAEFDRIKQQVLASAPPNLVDEADFQRWAGPKLADAIAVAENSPAPVEGSALSRIGHAIYNALPIELAQDLLVNGLTPKKTEAIVRGLVGAQANQFTQARDLAQQGRYVEAGGRALAGALPLLGPAAAHAGETIARGDVAGGLTESAALLAPFGAKYGIEAARTGSALPTAAKVAQAPLLNVPLRIPGLRPRDPGVRQLVDWGQRQGLNLDVATATDNPFLRTVQRYSGESALGSMTAGAQATENLRSFADKGQQLAEQATGRAAQTTTAEAGRKMTDDLRDLRETTERNADYQYGHGRELEAAAEPTYVKRSKTESPSVIQARQQAMRDSLGGDLPSDAELNELRRVMVELEQWGFRKHGFQETPTRHGGDLEVIPGAAGDPIYHDILQEAPGTADMTRGQVIASIRTALESGRFHNAAKGALTIARQRLQPGNLRNKPWLPMEAGVEPYVAVQAPVDMRAVKRALQEVWDRQTALGKVSQRDVQPGYGVLAEIMEGPDVISASQADRMLSAFKTAARLKGGAEIRHAGQGLAALAVKTLQPEVEAAMAKVPGMAEAFARGRAATTAKWDLERLRREVSPSQTTSDQAVFRKVTAANDLNFKLLERVADAAPDALPLIGKAKLDQLLTWAFDNNPQVNGAAKALKAWSELGTATKHKLWGVQHTADLDNLFRLNARRAINPNPSQTAFTAFKLGEAAGWLTSPGTAIPISGAVAVTARMLQSPTIARLLVQGAKIPIRSRAAYAAWSAQLQQAMDALPPEETPEPAETTTP